MTIDFPTILSYIPTVITTASVIAATLPTPVAGSTWATVVSGINFLAINFGHAKNAAPTVAAKVSVAHDVHKDLIMGDGPVPPVKTTFVP